MSSQVLTVSVVEWGQFVPAEIGIVPAGIDIAPSEIDIAPL